MSDRKTAAELRAMDTLCLQNWLAMMRHLAAVEEEREREPDDDTTECESCTAKAPHAAMYIDDEGLAFCGRCMANEFHHCMDALGIADAFDGDSYAACEGLKGRLDAARGEAGELAEKLGAARAKHREEYAEAIGRAEQAESALAQCERDLREEIARAEAAEKRVAELEDRLAVPGADLVKRLNDERDHYRERSLGFEKALAGQYARGIREGLERAAVVCDREAEACRGHQRALEKEPRAGKVPSSAMHECAANQNAACAHYIRAMKEQVK